MSLDLTLSREIEGYKLGGSKGKVKSIPASVDVVRPRFSGRADGPELIRVEE